MASLVMTQSILSLGAKKFAMLSNVAPLSVRSPLRSLSTDPSSLKMISASHKSVAEDMQLRNVLKDGI